jgi:hypothetical protein
VTAIERFDVEADALGLTHEQACDLRRDIFFAVVDALGVDLGDPDDAEAEPTDDEVSCFIARDEIVAAIMKAGLRREATP